MGRLRWRFWAEPCGGDAGATLAELLVGITVMVIAATIGTAGLVQAYQVFNSFEARTNGQQQLTVSFERLDREIRYATAVSQPAVVNSDYFVEYLLGQTGTPTCVELRLHPATAQLQRRTWPDGSPTSASRWLPLASEIYPVTDSTGQAVQPFQLTAATTVVNYERLQVSLSSTEGTGSSASTRQSIVTWAVMNADRSAATDVCTDGRALS
jgi:hypothetical protein